MHNMCLLTWVLGTKFSSTFIADPSLQPHRYTNFNGLITSLVKIKYQSRFYCLLFYLLYACIYGYMYICIHGFMQVCPSDWRNQRTIFVGWKLRWCPQELYVLLGGEPCIQPLNILLNSIDLVDTAVEHF